MPIKVSVIIPVFNAEAYLRECIDSVLSQDLQDLEVICVDDGSGDRSLEILAEYEEYDKRVIVIRQQNSGAGAARNNGLTLARGEYVFFMDADDVLLPGCVEKLWHQAHSQRLDVLRCRAIDYDNETGETTHSLHNYLKRVPPFLFGVPIRFEPFCWLFPKINVAPWGGIARREFLLENKIEFNHLKCVNDRSFFWEIVLKAKRIGFSRVCAISYRMNLPGSLIGTRIRNFECHFQSYRMVEQLCRDLPDRYRRCILNGELLDLANWLEQGMKTPLGAELEKQIRRFLETMDKSPWNGRINETKWYRRINACKPCG